MTPIAHQFVLHTLRAPQHACGSVAVGGGTLTQEPAPAPFLRGAAARVVPWALSRAAGVLHSHSRRPLRFGQGQDATPDERVVLNIIAALGEGDHEAAERASEWLVRPSGRDALLRALQPAVDGLR